MHKSEVLSWPRASSGYTMPHVTYLVVQVQTHLLPIIYSISMLHHIFCNLIHTFIPVYRVEPTIFSVSYTRSMKLISSISNQTQPQGINDEKAIRLIPKTKRQTKENQRSYQSSYPSNMDTRVRGCTYKCLHQYLGGSITGNMQKSMYY